MIKNLLIVAFLLVGLLGQSKKNLEKIYWSIAGPAPGKYLIKITENKGLDNLLAQSMQTISNPFEKMICVSSTLVNLDEEKSSARISLGRIYHLDANAAKNPLPLGPVSVWCGKSPIEFTGKKHLWSGHLMQTEWICQKSQMIQNLHIVRQIAVDHENRCFISIRLTSPRKQAAVKDFRLRLENLPSDPGPWRIWVRCPDGTIKQPDKISGSMEIPLTLDKKQNSFLLVAKWNNPQISEDTIDEGSKSSPNNPIASLRSSAKKWFTQTCPAWDCPDPQLNKLWAAQVVAIYSQLILDNTTKFIRFRSDNQGNLPNILDARWLRDRRIAFGTILSQMPDTTTADALLRCHPHPDLEKILPKKRHGREGVCIIEEFETEEDFLKWCHSFFEKNNLYQSINFALSDNNQLKTDLPAGVIDSVVTKLVGIQVADSDCVKIKPAPWLNHWPYFAIDNLPYRDHNLTIVWQSPDLARRYQNMNSGLNIFIDGNLAKHTEKLEPVELELK